MNNSTNKLIRIGCFAIATLGATAVISTVIMPQAAYAKSNNASSNSGNGGGGRETRGNPNRDRTTRTSPSNRPAANPRRSDRPNTAPRRSQNPISTDTAPVAAVAHPSELGALNAAHANENALANASPNSRVGRIAIYRDTVLAGQQLETDLSLEQETLAGMLEPTRPSDEISDEISQSMTNVSDAQTALADLLTLQAESPDDPTIAESVLAAQLEVDELAANLTSLQAELDDTYAYESQQEVISGLNDQLADQPALETSTLEAAANKPVTEAVELAVKELLGLD